MSDKQKARDHKQNRKPNDEPLRVGEPLPLTNGQVIEMFASLDPEELTRLMTMVAMRDARPRLSALDVIVLQQLLGEATHAAMTFAAMISGVLDECLIPVLTNGGELGFAMTEKGRKVKAERDATERGSR